MAVYPFLGMRGTGNWTDDARPQSWREKILELFPNGSMPLTAITGMTKRGGQLTDIRHNWKTRTLSTQSGAVTDVYIDAGMATAYVYASHQTTHGVASAVVYAKCAAAVAAMIREGHKVLLRDSDHVEVDVNAKVVAVNVNGANSYIACRLLEADDNGSVAATYNLATVDRILVIGNINSQGGTRPRAITYDPADVYNVSGIWRTPVEISRTGMRTKIRGRDAYLDQKEQGLLYHGIEMEKDLIWGIRTENTGANGKPENTIMGLIEFIRSYASANVSDFSLDSDFSGQTWAEGGKTWLENMLKTIFSQGSGELGDEAFAVMGAGAALGIQRMVEANSMYTIGEAEAAYGIRVTRLSTVFGDLFFKIHPLFNWETTNQYSCLILPPANIGWLPMDETHYKPDELWDKGGSTGVDGKQEEWLTEGTYEYNLVGPWGWLNGVGQNNAV